MTKFAPGNVQAAKVQPEIVFKIRAEYAAGGISHGGLARKYHLSVNTIGRIVRGETHQHVPQVITEEEIALGAARLLRMQEEQGSKAVEKLNAEVNEARSADSQLDSLTDPERGKAFGAGE